MIFTGQPLPNIRDLMAPYITPGDAVCAEHPVNMGQYYEYYASYAAQRQPQRVLEIGVLYGYSLVAMLLGCPRIQTIYGFDSGGYGVPLLMGETNVRQLFMGALCMQELDTQALTSLSIAAGDSMDLIHVDGDHTPEGAAHDLDLVWPHLAPQGWIILDDVTLLPALRTVGEAFAQRHGLETQFVPTTRGHLLLARGT